MCVTPQARAQAVEDNQQAQFRWNPQGGSYGPDTCAPGYVWREACGPSDHVCVRPDVRAQAAADNQLAEARKEPNGGAYGPDTCRVGFVWREACGPHAKELIPGKHQANNSGEVTKIPTNGIAVGGTMFLHYMSVRKWEATAGAWTINYSSLAYSDNQGQDWIQVPFRWAGGGNFGQVALVRHREFDMTIGWISDYIYMFGIPAGRSGGVKLARVPATRRAMLDPNRYSYYRNIDGREEWVKGTGQEVAATEIVPDPVGEFSVMYNRYLGQWIMLYLKQDEQTIWLRHAQRLTGPWSAPRTVYVNPNRLDPLDMIYAPYMHPSLVENDGEYVYFTLSRWKPYQVYLMKVRLSNTILVDYRILRPE